LAILVGLLLILSSFTPWNARCFSIGLSAIHAFKFG
jgi:hypothetical protein